jgi:hypothetical protein
MSRLIERLVIVCTALCGIVYGERLVRSTLSMIARLDPAHVHGVIVSGSALGFVQAGIAIGVIVCAVIPALLSLFDGRRAPAGLVVGELVTALLLFGASQQVLRQSVHARIVGTGQARVLAVQASATLEAVE